MENFDIIHDLFCILKRHSKSMNIELNFIQFYDLLVDETPVQYATNQWSRKMVFDRFVSTYNDRFEEFIEYNHLYEYYVNQHDFNFYFYIQYIQPVRNQPVVAICPYV